MKVNKPTDSTKTPEQIEHRREYMREYKKKHYNANKDQSREDQRLYYHCSKAGLHTRELKQFTVMKADFTKLLCLLTKIKDSEPDALKEYLSTYAEDL